MDDAAESLTPAGLAALALAHGLPLDRAELAVLSKAAIALMDGIPSADRPLTSLPASVMPPAGASMTSGRAPVIRDPGRPARCGDDPCNAIVRWCLVGGDIAGSLSGMRLATKDSIAIA